MKRIKTLIVLTMAFGAITFSSCKKDKQTSAVTVTATAPITADIDGTTTTFNVHALATTGTVGGGAITVITGTTSAGNTVSITLNGTVTAGKTYSISATPGNAPTLSYSTASDETFMNPSTSPLYPVIVTVNSISLTSISGTFSGSVFEAVVATAGGDLEPTKVITNGKFNVSFISGS